MNVNLGTLVVSDAERREIGGGKLATREEIREFCFEILLDVLSQYQEPLPTPRQDRARKRRASGKLTKFEKALRNKR